MSLPLRLLAASVAALLLAGCGGQTSLDRKALSQEAKTLQSLAAEGGLLAANSARGRSTAVFTRVHAGYLHAAAQTSVSALARGGTAPARRLASLAGRISADLQRLSRSGSHRAAQQRLARELTASATAASKLGKSL
jgi:hypothetical protein